MEVSVRYLGDTKFEVAARGHRVICDQPIDNGGADEGMSPPEFLLASLATCAGYYATQYLKDARTTRRRSEGAGHRGKGSSASPAGIIRDRSDGTRPG